MLEFSGQTLLAKFGRNQPCPCGSGKRYKHCHGIIAGGGRFRTSDDVFQQIFREVQAEDAQRKKQQGLGKPIISNEYQGQRSVAVCDHLYHSSNWTTFHDFLREYIFLVLGEPWADEQRKKPVAERHQIVRWFDQAMLNVQAMSAENNGSFFGPMTGAQRAFLNLAYNLYLIAHHAEPEKAEEILDSFVRRLKSTRNDDFIGKLFETYASAVFLKAGFKIEYENEKDGSDSHVEFTAMYPKTGRKFAVEVKTRNRKIDIDGPMDEAKRLRVGQKLVKALRKSTDHERIVFIEVNVPDVVGQDYSGTWVESALDQITEAEGFLDRERQHYPPAYVIVTNHAYHNNLEAADVGLEAIADGYRINDFGPRVQVSRFKEHLEILERHKEMLALVDSLKSHSHIPITFDGEIPEFTFGEEDEYPRLKIGYEYLVPDGNGDQVPGVLEQATVMEEWGKAIGTYRLNDGRGVIVSHELTEREMGAWRRYPETFFGQLEERRSEPQDWLELADFLYRSYRNTSKERLLEFMEGHQDIKYLTTLSQEELAIVYCELTAWAAGAK